MGEHRENREAPRLNSDARPQPKKEAKEKTSRYRWPSRESLVGQDFSTHQVLTRPIELLLFPRRLNM